MGSFLYAALPLLTFYCDNRAKCPASTGAFFDLKNLNIKMCPLVNKKVRVVPGAIDLNATEEIEILINSKGTKGIYWFWLKSASNTQLNK